MARHAPLPSHTPQLTAKRLDPCSQLYVGIRRGSTEAAARRFGPAAAIATAESLDNLTAHGISTAAANLPLSSMNWALSAGGAQPQRRLLATPIGHRADGATSEGNAANTDGAPQAAAACSADLPAMSEEGEGEEMDAWILLGSPWLEGFVAVRGDLLAASDVEGSPEAAPAAAAAAAPWRRVWCVLQDSAFAFFEHERAASAFNAEPIAVIEWLHVRSLRLLIGAAAANAAAPVASPPPSPGTAAADGHCFEVQLADGRILDIRADTPTQRALWAREILRLASWRAVHALQRELATEWHDVRA